MTDDPKPNETTTTAEPTTVIPGADELREAAERERIGHATAIGERDAEITSLRGVLADRDKAIDDHAAALRDRDQTISGLKSRVDDIEAKADLVFHKDVAPWVRSLCSTMAHDEVSAVMPLVQDAAKRVEAQLANHDAANPLAYADSIAAILRDTAIQCAETGLQVAGSSILAAVVTAIAKQKAPALLQHTNTDPVADQSPATSDPLTPPAPPAQP